MANIVNNVDPFGDGSGVALYQFDGNANDTGGNYNGTWHGTEQYDTGKFGQAAKFDGSSYVDIFNHNPSENIVSITLWVKPISVTDNTYRKMFSIKNFNLINVYNSELRDNTGATINTGLSSAELSFTYVEFDKNNNTIKASINNNTLNTINHNAWNDTLTVVASASDHSFNFLGLIDQVRIFNRALTEEEVAILYNEYKPSKSFVRSNIF